MLNKKLIENLTYEGFKKSDLYVDYDYNHIGCVKHFVDDNYHIQIDFESYTHIEEDIYIKLSRGNYIPQTNTIVFNTTMLCVKMHK